MSKRKDITDPAQAQMAAWRLANGATITDLCAEFRCNYDKFRSRVEVHLPEGAWRKIARRNLATRPARISAGHRRRRRLRDIQTPDMVEDEVRRATARRLLGWMCSGCGWSPGGTAVPAVECTTAAVSPVNDPPEKCPKCNTCTFEQILGASSAKAAEAVDETVEHPCLHGQRQLGRQVMTA